MKYLRRLIWWIAQHLFVLLIVLALMVVSFYYAMNMTNIYVVLKDGMAARAQVIMMEEDDSRLSKYFQDAFLQKDAALLAVEQGTSPYRDYNIRGIDHRVNIDFAWVWPWDTTARVDVTERIPRIDGRAKGTRADALVASGGSAALYPPAWQAAKYRAVLVRENGQWHIKSLTLIENLNP